MEEKYLPSKLQDVSKQPHNVPFTPTAQTAKNVGMIIKCSECKKPRLMFSKNKLKGNDYSALKRILSGLEYFCGSSFKEFLGDKDNSDGTIFEKVFVKENLSCSSNIELPYFSCDNLKPICIYCGTGKNVIKSITFYPKCAKCKNEKDIPNRKRKTIVASDLTTKKKK